MEIRTALKDYICNQLLGTSPDELRDNQLLFSEKILDSMHFQELLAFLETNWKIKVNALEITFENFDSIELIEKFVEKKNNS